MGSNRFALHPLYPNCVGTGPHCISGLSISGVISGYITTKEFFIFIYLVYRDRDVYTMRVLCSYTIFPGLKALGLVVISFTPPSYKNRPVCCSHV